MKAVILAGGLGTRISEETSLRPKPMVEIGGRPILWHILKLYSQHGINDFIICCGYKGYVIKEYFANYFLHTSDVTFDMSSNRMEVHNSIAEPWRVTLVDTGESTGTGGRLRRVAKYLTPGESFCMTYGDGVADVDITASIAFHKQHRKLVTLTSVQPVARFGALGLKDTQIYSFQENRRTRAAGSTVASLSSSPAPSTPSLTMGRCSSVSPSKPLSPKAKSTRSSITASGRRWTPSAISNTSTSSGAAERRHGRPGNPSRRRFGQHTQELLAG